MEVNLADLTHFVDLGGIFILALIILNTLNKKVDSIEDKLTKILTLLLVLAKLNAKIDGVENILGDDYSSISSKIHESGISLLEKS